MTKHFGDFTTFIKSQAWSECPLNDVEVLLPDSNEGQVVRQDVNLRHQDLIRVPGLQLVDVEASGVDDPEKGREILNQRLPQYFDANTP